MFIFGLTAAEVAEKRRQGYDPRIIVEGNPRLQAALAAISNGTFSPDQSDRFAPLVDNLYEGDYFMNTVDFESYCSAQAQAVDAYRDSARWWRAAVLNTAHVGWFSSDRTIREYDEKVWHSRSNQVA
jgi:starch phosphorylase